MRASAWFTAIFAAYVWRNYRQLSNLLPEPNFPVGYYSEAQDWSTSCKLVTDPVNDALRYCEDAAFWDVSGVRHVLVSCDPGRKNWNTVMGPLRDPEPHGALWIYTQSTGKAERIEFLNYPPGHDFHPLGLEVYPSVSGSSSNLFVVNHARERTYIEMFTMSPLTPTRATWVRTITSPYFFSPNSVALSSPTSFYVTNDHLMTRRLPSPFGNILPLIETLLVLPFSWVSHISLDPNTGETTHTFAAKGISFANGVSISPDGRELAVASTSRSEILFYKRDTEDHVLTYLETVPVPMTADNIMYDDSGSLIVGGHPSFGALSAVARGKPTVAPSWIVAVQRRAPAIEPEAAAPGLGPAKGYDLSAPISAATRAPVVLSHTVETLFQSNGTGFSTGCTGLRDGESGRLFVTGLYQRGMLVCTPQAGKSRSQL